MTIQESNDKETPPFLPTELSATKAKSFVPGTRVRTICMFCKRILQLDGTWEPSLESVQEELNSYSLSHGLCPLCLQIHYPEVLKYPN